MNTDDAFLDMAAVWTGPVVSGTHIIIHLNE